jgi:hypothetical protein
MLSSFGGMQCYCLCLPFYPEDGDEMFFQNASELLGYKALTEMSNLHTLKLHEITNLLT